MSTLIRPSVDADIPSIQTLYAHHVLHGTGTFETDVPSLQDMLARRLDVLQKNLPYLVLVQDNTVIGFAYCNWFKPRAAYRFSAEDAIYLAPNQTGKGYGTLLLNALIAAAKQADIRKLIAVIGDSANAGSVGLHRRCGFTDVGMIKNCGYKFDRWLDIVLMERELT